MKRKEIMTLSKQETCL